jgi:acyl-CoA thioesterase FadM
MVLLHSARIAGTVTMGLLRRRVAPPPAGLAVPHIYRARAGFLDLDLYLHMNNSAYTVHTELARWNLFSYSGLLGFVLRRKLVLLVTNSSITYRSPIGPWAPFEIHTKLAGWDERQMTIMHTFIGKKGRRAAHNVVSARVMDAATGALIPPAPLLMEAMGVPPVTPDLSVEEEEVLRRFHALGEAMRDTTSSRSGRRTS